MSKVFTYFTLIVYFLILNACADQDINPSDTFVVTLSQDDSIEYTTQNFEKGEQIRINGIGNVPAGITGFVLEKNINGAGFSPIPSEEFTLVSGTLPQANGSNFFFSFIADIEVNESAGQSVTLRITVNSFDQTQTASCSYQVVAQGQGGSGGIYPLLHPAFEVTLGGQGTDIGSYFTTSLGSSQGIYTDTQIPTLTSTQKRSINISTGIADISGQAATGENATVAALISPNDRLNRGFEDAGLGVDASRTSFKYEANLSSQASFDAITSTSLSLEVIHNTEATFQALSQGATYSFVGQNGKKGYLRVLSITGTEESQEVTLEVLAQQ